MASPWAAKAKKTTNPTAAKKNATSPWAVKKTTTSPWAKRKDDRDTKELLAAKLAVDKASKDHDAASEHETKLFKRVDKMELAGRTNSQKYHDARNEWRSASRMVDVTYVRLMGVISHERALQQRAAATTK